MTDPSAAERRPVDEARPEENAAMTDDKNAMRDWFNCGEDVELSAKPQTENDGGRIDLPIGMTEELYDSALKIVDEWENDGCPGATFLICSLFDLFSQIERRVEPPSGEYSAVKTGPGVASARVIVRDGAGPMSNFESGVQIFWAHPDGSAGQVRSTIAAIRRQIDELEQAIARL